MNLLRRLRFRLPWYVVPEPTARFIPEIWDRERLDEALRLPLELFGIVTEGVIQYGPSLDSIKPEHHVDCN